MLRNAILLLIVLLLGAGGMYLFMQPEKAPANEPKVGNISDAKGVIVPQEVPFVTDDTLKQSFPEDNLSVNAVFPKIVLPHEPSYEAQTNDVLRALVMEEIDRFRLTAKEEAMNELVPKDMGSDITINYTTLLLSPSLVSFRFNVSAYARGAAHPDNYSRVVNYDIPRHTVLRTGDLFLPGASFLAFLSSTTQMELLERCVDCDDFGAAMIITGTEPTKENFLRVGVVPEGLLVIFDPYQIAPYARGSQEVMIPIGNARNIIAPAISGAISTAATNTSQTN